MKKLFEIPIYALKESTLNARIRNHIQTLKTNLPLLDPNTASQIIEIETFPKRGHCSVWCCTFQAPLAEAFATLLQLHSKTSRQLAQFLKPIA